MRVRALRWPALLTCGLLAGCSQITLLRTRELREVGEKVDSVRTAVAEVQKSIDDLSLKQGGVSSQMRADLTSMLTDLRNQISRLHNDIDATQRRLGDLGQRLDRLEQRKIVVSGGSATPTDSGSTGASAGTAPSVKVVDGLDLERLFGQAREDYIKARYDLAYQGFKTVYERDVGGSYKEQALYWMAECMWKSDRQDDALELYQRVLNEFPNGDKMCSARFKMGLIYNDKQDNLRRNNAWSQLIDACPQSNEANRARDMMHP
jgi:TolA-binding protein